MEVNITSGTPERAAVLLVATAFLLGALLIYIMPGEQEFAELLLFIPATMIVLVPTGILVSPAAAERAVCREMTRRRACRTMLASVVFLVLVPITELFGLWPVLYKYLYFDSLPIALGFAAASFIASILRLQLPDPSSSGLPLAPLVGAISTMTAAGSVAFYLLAVNFSFINWGLFILEALTLFYCAKCTCDIGFALVDFAVTGSRE